MYKGYVWHVDLKAMHVEVENFLIKKLKGERCSFGGMNLEKKKKNHNNKQLWNRKLANIAAKPDAKMNHQKTLIRNSSSANEYI